MSALSKLISETAPGIAKDHPVELSTAIPLLDRLLVDQTTDLWYAWCSLRQAVIWQSKGKSL